MMNTRKRLWGFCIVWGIVCALWAKNQHLDHYLSRYALTEVTMSNGLPHNYVDDILKDSQGYLWLSTQGGGVARYDGKEFLVFNANTEKDVLRSNFVNNLCEDNFRRIWMASELGLDILDTRNMKLTTLKDLMATRQADSLLSAHPVTFLMRSQAGNLWACSNNRIYKIVFDQEGLIKGIYDIAPIQMNDRGAFLCEVDGYLWFQWEGQVCRISENGTGAQKPVRVSAALELPELLSVFCMYRRQDDVWIGTSNGLFRYNLMADSFNGYYHRADDEHSLSQNYITSITVAANDLLLVGTLWGINAYNPAQDEFDRIQHDDNSLNVLNLNSNFINVLYSDSQNGIIWIGTESGGLTKMRPSYLAVTNYNHSPYQSGSLSKNIVNAVVEDENGKLWVGVVEGGLNCRLPGTDQFIYYTTDAPACLSHNSVSALALGDKDRLYVGTWGGGLGWIDRNHLSDKRFRKIPIDDLFIADLVYDSINNLLWISTATELYTYNPATEEVRNPFADVSHTYINRNALGGCITREGELWIATSFGLCQIDLKAYGQGRLVYKLYASKLSEPQSKEIERITSVFQSKDGTLWIGTNGNGFYKRVKSGNDYVFQNYTTQNGLASNNVRGIVEDWYGNLWITTLNGLSRFLVTEESFRNFSQDDGLISDQFYWKAVAVSHDGQRLFLGTVNGLIEIRSLMETYRAFDYPIAFTHIKVFNEEVYPGHEGIVMHESEKALYIEFAALDYFAPSQALYSYRLKGFDEKWNVVPATRRWGYYTNLKPGKYVFQVQYSSDGKHWQPGTEELVIEVQPYFYKTGGFILAVVLLTGFIIYRILLWRYRIMKKQQVMLHAMVEERTHKLEEQKKQLSVQKEELAHQNELLKEQNEKITDQKNKILEMSHRVEELTVDKLAFFTNITHEFRTPLTLIVGPIERALKLSYNPQVIEQLHLVERNSKYLLSLINQLLDFRKVEEGHLKIICHHGNLKRFLDDLLPAFEAYSQDNGICFRTLIRLEDPYMMFDEDILRKVLTNLISNALKFTPKGGAVTVYAAVLNTVDGERLFMGVKDTGKGIPEEDINRIFNRFYQSDNQNQVSVSGQSGTGIGLYLCKRLISLLGGNIRAKNNRKAGSSFHIVLPVERGSSEVTTERNEEDEVQVEKFKGGRMTVLVVEDNKDMRDYIRSILTEYYNVLEASQGEEGLQVLKQNNVDFIISDLMMPVMDGMEFSRRVKNNFSVSHLPFLMLTAKTSDEARLESYKMGADAFLLKPFDENLLLVRMANILENRKRVQQKFALSMNVEELEVEEESGDKKFLDKAISVMKKNYGNSEFEVSDFIEAMGVGRNLLNKKMQSLTGQSAGQFIRNYRLNLARELLLRNRESRTMNISEIAYEVGFNDPKYFTRCFTKHFNVTPSSMMGDKE